MSDPAQAFDPAAHPRKLNLGCGFDHRPGYLNVDLQAFHEPDLVADIRHLDALPSDYYDEILAQDILEHLPRTQTSEVLAEWNRVLRVGGELRLRVPGLDLVTARWDLATESLETQRKLIQMLYGTQAYDGDFHYTSFTRVLLAGYLTECGFEARSYAVTDGWLYDVVAAKTHTPSADDDLAFVRDPEEFLDRAYRAILERDPDPQGRAYFLEKLRSGELSKRLVLDALGEARPRELGGRGAPS